MGLLLLEPGVLVPSLRLLLLKHERTFQGSKLISPFLRHSYPLLSLIGMFCHVHHPLLHHIVLLLLTLERIRLVGLDRLNQGHYRLLHFLLVVQRQLENI